MLPRSRTSSRRCSSRSLDASSSRARAPSSSTSPMTTRGFRDVLELRRHNSAELYDILWDPPAPLVPRRLRLEVGERVDYAGAVVEALDEPELERALDRLRDHEIESLAVCFLHSYANPDHERRVQELVA